MCAVLPEVQKDRLGIGQHATTPLLLGRIAQHQHAGCSKRPSATLQKSTLPKQNDHSKVMPQKRPRSLAHKDVKANRSSTRSTHSSVAAPLQQQQRRRASEPVGTRSRRSNKTTIANTIDGNAPLRLAPVVSMLHDDLHERSRACVASNGLKLDEDVTGPLSICSFVQGSPRPSTCQLYFRVRTSKQELACWEREVDMQSDRAASIKRLYCLAGLIDCRTNACNILLYFYDPGRIGDKPVSLLVLSTANETDAEYWSVALRNAAPNCLELAKLSNESFDMLYSVDRHASSSGNGKTHRGDNDGLFQSLGRDVPQEFMPSMLADVHRCYTTPILPRLTKSDVEQLIFDMFKVQWCIAVCGLQADLDMQAQDLHESHAWVADLESIDGGCMNGRIILEKLGRGLAVELRGKVLQDLIGTSRSQLHAKTMSVGREAFEKNALQALFDPSSDAMSAIRSKISEIFGPLATSFIKSTQAASDRHSDHAVGNVQKVDPCSFPEKELAELFQNEEVDLLSARCGKEETVVNFRLGTHPYDLGSSRIDKSRVRPHTLPSSPWRSEHVALPSKLTQINTRREVPEPVSRTRYDHIMASRINRKSGVHCLVKVLNFALHWRQLTSSHRSSVHTTGRCKEIGLISPLERERHLREQLGNLSREEAIQAGRELLRERCMFLSLLEVEIEEDGNCQFRAVSHELFGSQQYHALIRAEIVAHLRRHSTDYRDFFPIGDWEPYLRELESLGTWGDELTLNAVAEAFGVRIHVITSTEDNWHLVYEPHGGAAPGARELFLTYIAPIHYNVVQPLR